jgi:ribonuclease III
MGENMGNIESLINYKFKNNALLTEALTHSSYYNENQGTPSFNEKIEFLGDAILQFVMSSFLYKKYPDMDEGELTKIRSNLVCESNLAKVSNEIKLGEFLFLGKGEELSGGRQRESILADALEAIIGAIYLDSNIEEASKFINDFIAKDSAKIKVNVPITDYKSSLQEAIQKFSKEPVVYKILKESGPDHHKYFEVCVVHKKNQLGKGSGKTKKEAEQNSALEALKNL